MAVAHGTFEELRQASLAELDPDIAALIGRELERQRGQIELIASENFTWPSVFEAVGSVPTNKYAEGYPGRRYYGGCEVVDEIETLAIERGKAFFGADHANVQPHAGAQANMAVYFACLQPGDTILTLELAHGGHLTHGLKVNFSGRLYNIVHYGVSRETNMVDYDEVLRLATEHRPGLIVCGGSAYPRTVEADRFREIADEVDALLLCDMAHFAGLVAAGLHPNPVPHCDFVTSTTHKTLSGPRAGFILCREEWAQKVDRRNSDWTGKDAEERLDEVKLTVNRNTVPFDERPPTVASGIRIGTPAATMRGFDEDDFREVGRIIGGALMRDDDTDSLAARSIELCKRRPLY